MFLGVPRRQYRRATDAPDLPEYIQFCREHHSPGAGFLQMNGFAFREEKELQELILYLTYSCFSINKFVNKFNR